VYQLNKYYICSVELKKTLTKKMHNLTANFGKFLDICNKFGKNFTNEKGNITRRGVIPKFSDLEVVALSLTAEALSIDSENLLFHKLNAEYKSDFPNLISRRQFNDRRKILLELTEKVRRYIAEDIDEFEDTYCVDSKPFEVCKLSRAKRNQVGKTDFEKAPSIGYCASQERYYFGYKLHILCGIRGVVHSFDLTKAEVADIHYLQDVKTQVSDCNVLGDKGYLSSEIQLDLFETANIRLEVPMRRNQKNYKPQFYLFKKYRKRVETLFSQLDDQFMMTRNYAKDTAGIFTRILAKITAATALQYINKINNRPIGQLKYALI
jgi:DNA-binding MarR family transcriptional regulator